MPGLVVIEQQIKEKRRGLVHIPNFFGGVAGSEDVACATLPTTPLDFQGKIKHFCHPTLLKVRSKITVTPPSKSILWCFNRL